MTDSTQANENYTLMADEVDKVRRASKGSFFIKQKDSLLPHPSQVDQSSSHQRLRYAKYKAGAEFPEYTKTTLATLIGKLQLDDTSVVLPSKLEYLESDVDGDGVSLKGLAESCASNTLQVKWHLLLTDYKGLSDVALEDTSIADIEMANARATINQYSRESVIDWHYSRINGVMQFTYLLLAEVGTTFDTETMTHSEVTSYLRLVLDEDGYYQQKSVSNSDNGLTWGEENRVYVNNEPLRFIPVDIASDEELPQGKLPLATGFLTAIADLALYSYRVSADYKESLAALQPTLNVMGVSNQDWDEFQQTNGREYVAYGASDPNIWPGENTKVELLEPSMSLQQFESYQEKNAAQVRAVGGVYNTDASVQRTATEVINEAGTALSVLTPIVDSTEQAITKSILYCGMFEGMYSQDNLMANMDDIVFDMPREFAINKLTDTEVKSMLEVQASGIISQDELLRILKAGGRLVGEIDEIKGEIESNPPLIA